jgi:hypothetical protein
MLNGAATALINTAFDLIMIGVGTEITAFGAKETLQRQMKFLPKNPKKPSKQWDELKPDGSESKEGKNFKDPTFGLPKKFVLDRSWAQISRWMFPLQTDIGTTMHLCEGLGIEIPNDNDGNTRLLNEALLKHSMTIRKSLSKNTQDLNRGRFLCDEGDRCPSILAEIMSSSIWAKDTQAFEALTDPHKMEEY